VSRTAAVASQPAAEGGERSRRRQPHPIVQSHVVSQPSTGGTGELSAPFPITTSPPPLLLSLATALLSTGFSSLLPVVSLFTSPVEPVCSAGGAFQYPSPHETPVKDLMGMGLRCHLRQGLPLRSRARRLALMLPVLALGPRRCDGIAGLAGPRLVVVPS